MTGVEIVGASWTDSFSSAFSPLIFFVTPLSSSSPSSPIWPSLSAADENKSEKPCLPTRYPLGCGPVRSSSSSSSSLTLLFICPSNIFAPFFCLHQNTRSDCLFHSHSLFHCVVSFFLTISLVFPAITLTLGSYFTVLLKRQHQDIISVHFRTF